MKDFIELEKFAVENNLFKPNFLFYSIHFLHVILFELLGAIVLYYFGNGWLSYLTATVLLTISQVDNFSVFFLIFVITAFIHRLKLVGLCMTMAI